MTPQIIFSIISVVVLLTTTQLVKKFANEFYTKISKFIPIIIGVISIIAQGVFNFASAGSIDGVEVISFIDKIDFEKVKKLNELLESYKKIKKRLRTVSYFELGIGIPCVIFGYLPIWTEEQKNIQNLLLGIGFSNTASGLITFTFTINF